MAKTRAEAQSIRRAAVAAHFKEGPASTIALAAQELGIPTATLNRDLAALRKAGRLEYQVHMRSGL